MRHLLLVIIKFYWLAIPKNKRRNCLFKKSCSHFVFEVTAQHGLVKGLQALQYRFKNCRPGAALFINPVTGQTEMILPGHNIISQQDIAQHLLLKYNGVAPKLIPQN
ncbi:membrane protein insertion efficiency factor YidD [Flavobacterium subsaxonicum]|uniref:membrane protein insertion efficiency factor YidD n=1 Tax=Flavobacterium subsaxonicum TaxID=426226 RepID=UPI000686AC9F|nr:membrane protein insertion efficiency factor YidD [Flavobacterium subsaxonicum]